MTRTTLRFYAYVVVDSLAASPVPLAVCMTRALGRAWIQTHGAVRTYRVRRAAVTLFPN